MSKVVKGIGRAIGKVVKGVVKAVKGFAKSTVGKVLIAAATVYFGGAAIMGAVGGASAGTGVMGTIGGALKGATAGIANAWSGLTAAGSAALGGNFSAAGSSLGSGFTGSYGAGQSAVLGSGTGLSASAGGATGLTVPSSSAATTGGSQYSLTAGSGGGAGTGLTAGPSALTTPPSVGGSGIVSRAWNSLGDYGKMAAVSGTMNLAGGAIQGYGQQKAMEDQRNYELEQQAAARDRYNQNVGTRLWGEPSQDTTGGAYQYAGSPAFRYDPVAEARAIGARYMPQAGGPMMVRQPGLIGSSMPTLNGFPVYNPTYG